MGNHRFTCSYVVLLVITVKFYQKLPIRDVQYHRYRFFDIFNFVRAEKNSFGKSSFKTKGWLIWSWKLSLLSLFQLIFLKKNSPFNPHRKIKIATKIYSTILIYLCTSIYIYLFFFHLIKKPIHPQPNINISKHRPLAKHATKLYTPKNVLLVPRKRNTSFN